MTSHVVVTSLLRNRYSCSSVRLKPDPSAPLTSQNRPLRVKIRPLTGAIIDKHASQTAHFLVMADIDVTSHAYEWSLTKVHPVLGSAFENDQNSTQMMKSSKSIAHGSLSALFLSAVINV